MHLEERLVASMRAGRDERPGMMSIILLVAMASRSLSTVAVRVPVSADRLCVCRKFCSVPVGPLWGVVQSLLVFHSCVTVCIQLSVHPMCAANVQSSSTARNFVLLSRQVNV